MEGYAKLWSSLTRSSLWQRESKDVRLLFISMLALADAEGYVGSSVPGLAKDANLTIEEVQAALNVLQSPDLYSRNPANDGRRIKKVHRGWMILNYKEHRDGEMKRERRRQLARARMKKIRERRKREREAGSAGGAPLSPVTHGDAALRDVTPECAVLRDGQNAPLSNKDLQTPVAQPLRETCAYAEAEAEAEELIDEETPAEKESTAANRARCWISAEMPSHLRSGVPYFTRLIMRLGYDEAVKQVREARKPGVGNPFAYVERCLDNDAAETASKSAKRRLTPREQRHQEAEQAIEEM